MHLTESTLSRSFITSVFALAALLLLAFSGSALARPHATPTPVPSVVPEDPAVTTIARREFVAWQAGVVNRDHYDPRTLADMTDDKITTTSKALGVLGTLESMTWVGPIALDDKTVRGYIYQMNCANYPVFEFLTIGSDGKIQGIYFKDKLSSPKT